MPQMLGVTAFELRHPVVFLILMIAYDAPFRLHARIPF
jgi:hypothetical protein